MTSQPSRNFARLATAIIVGAVIVSTAVFGSSTLQKSVTITSENASTQTTSIRISADSSVTLVIAQSARYQVQSSYDCIAGHVEQPFNVTSSSLLEGGISAGPPGVTLYVATAQDAQTISMGHPDTWDYSSGLITSTNFSITLATGSYVIWMEGVDLGCGASTVMPLEQLTNITVTQALVLSST